MASTYLTKTFGSHGDRTKWTYSAWIKRSGLGSSTSLIGVGSGSNQEHIYFSSDKIHWWIWTADAYKGRLTTNRLFRDCSAWYHLVFRFDSSNSTAGDRMRMYVNGVEETSFEHDINPDADRESWINSTTQQQIGASGNGSSPFDGYMSHINFADGQSLAPTEFGETDSNGVWKIKTSPSITYGDNGYFILKNGNSVTDQSGEGNNFTVAAGTLTNDKDCPSNVFDTYNPLTIIGTDPTLSNGNTKVSSTTGNHWRTTNNNIGMSSGKYYWETKVGTISGANYCRLGVVSENLISTLTTSAFQGNYAYGINWDGSKLVNSTQSSYTSIATGDIFMFALDLDNNFIYGGRNGTWINSGDPTSGGSGTNALSAVQSGQTYFISGSVYQSSQETNFGNGYFGTTAVSSAGSNASGIGIFEYDVPTGYTALSTKGLNE
jgi:hypothetical protein